MVLAKGDNGTWFSLAHGIYLSYQDTDTDSDSDPDPDTDSLDFLKPRIRIRRGNDKYKQI